MSTPTTIQLAAQLQLLVRVGTQGLQHAIPRFRGCVPVSLAIDEALVQQTSKQPQDVSVIRPAHGLGGRDSPTPRKYGERTKQPGFVSREEVNTPTDRPGEGAVTRRRVASRCLQQLEP